MFCIRNFKLLSFSNRYFTTTILKRTSIINHTKNEKNTNNVTQTVEFNSINQTIPTSSDNTIKTTIQPKIIQNLNKDFENNINKTTPLKQPTLQGKLVTLRPLKREDANEIIQASSDGELWNLRVTIVPGPHSIDKYLSIALSNTTEVMPFVIIDNQTNKIIGSTRFWKINWDHRKCEIGHTWLSKSFQKTGVNTECKYLLLQYAFEVMNCIRVQFTTDELNENSRNAISRLGAYQEGIVRNERIMPDGRLRNSVRFSIINSEWETVKSNLISKMLK